MKSEPASERHALALWARRGGLIVAVGFGRHGGGPIECPTIRGCPRAVHVLPAADASLHLDDPRDMPQIAALYGELARLTDSPVVELSRAVAVAEAERRLRERRLAELGAA